MKGAKIMMHIITDLILNMVRGSLADQYEKTFHSGTFHLTKVKIRNLHLP